MSANPRTMQGDVQPLVSGIVQFTTWQYYVTEDGNFVLSTNPGQSVANPTVTRDVKLPGGDQNAKCK